MGAPKKESFSKSHTSPQKGLHSGVFLALLSLVILLHTVIIVASFVDFVVIRAILTFCLVPVCHFAVVIICDALGVILRGSLPACLQTQKQSASTRSSTFPKAGQGYLFTSFVNPGLRYGLK